MKCRICERENKPTNRFCIYCGSPISDESIASQPGNPAIIGNVEPSVAQELFELRRLFRELTDRVDAFGIYLAEKSPEGSDIPHQAMLEGDNVLPPEELDTGIDNSHYETDQDQDRESVKITGSDQTPVAHSVAKSIDWERIIGLNWLAIVGVVALVIGVCFFLGLALQNNWIGEKGRFALAVSTGLVLIAAGEYFRSKAPIWSRSAIGGGISILNMSNIALIAMFEGSIIATAGYFLELSLIHI